MMRQPSTDEAAEKVCLALCEWVLMPGNYFGETPEQGARVGAALRAWMDARKRDHSTDQSEVRA